MQAGISPSQLIVDISTRMIVSVKDHRKAGCGWLLVLSMHIIAQDKAPGLVLVGPASTTPMAKY